MTTAVELVPLICVRCDTPVPAQPDEVAWVYTNCGQGLHLDVELGLVPLDVYYAASIRPNTAGRPFWVVEGNLSLRRETYDRSDQITQESMSFWGAPRRFYNPAFTCPLDEILDLGIDLVRNPPEMDDGPAASFAAVTLSREDVSGVVEFIVMAVEAEHKDQLKALNVLLELDQPKLWILP
jgi:hypothetical protein